MKSLSQSAWPDVVVCAAIAGLRVLAATLIGLAALIGPASAALPPAPGGPVLVITSASSGFGSFYPEILRNEGLNHFAVADIGAVNASTLSGYDLVILAKMPVSAAQADLLATWVSGGGNLIAMQPDATLSALLGITPNGSTLSNAYLRVDTSKLPGNGIVGQTIQFHGSADRYSLSGAASLATLYSNDSAATSNPAITLRAVGAGQAAAFTYDLATSIVYTRQGNPAWAAQERDGYAPIRSSDKFYGAASGDPQPDWIDLGKVAIPQADEQQRLLANLVIQMNVARKPLPRFWYFPNGKKAVVIMTGDDHGNGGTAGRFDQFKARSASGCSVTDWECIRGTSYIYTSTPMSDAQAATYAADGFEVGIHISTGCADYTPSSLQDNYSQQILEWQAKYGSIPAPATQRHHCIVWSDWSTGATVQLSHGIRLDTSYYYWPPGWVSNTPGLFTGSAMPMRFSALDGSLIDVYNAATQMTDESGQAYPYTVDTLLDRALGAEGYYGAFVVNAHTDAVSSDVADAVVASAQARSVSVISSRQMLDWLDARNSSSFGALAWNGSALSFSLTRAPGANGLQGMLPNRSSNGVLGSLSRGGNTVSFTVSTIKGIEYAIFAADTGTYLATYAADSAAPAVTASTPGGGATDVDLNTTPSATFSEAMNPASLNASTFELRVAGGSLVTAAVSYDAATRRATLVPGTALTASTAYTVTVKGGSGGVKDLAGNALVADFNWSFTTGTGGGSSNCPCSAWTPASAPVISSVDDSGSVELGVKFRANVNGFITGIRFYKGSGNTGTHVGSLWTTGGTRLATATFTGETASGWQQVNFATPVAIVANTVYVASYFAPNGHYAGDNGFFAAAGVDNGPIRLLSNSESGGNGVYAYSSSSSFPNSTYASSNYWVDVVFTTSTGPDTTPPTVSSTTPAAGASGVATATAVSASFSEPIDPATLGASSFELRGPGNVLVATTLSYDAAASRATLSPSAALSAATLYTATVKGGANGVKDFAGNAIASDVVWSFTTAADVGSGCPCSAWPPSATPANPTDPDTGSVELGVKFRANVNGFITGIRFYKGSGNTGTHVGSLWTTGGTRLATATFTGETASGWQQVNFATPVAIVANTVYVASYFAPNGHYAGDNGFFAAAGVDNGPIRLLSNSESGGNGVYAYSSSSSFPNSTYASSNYWVDVVFTTSTGPDTTPPTVSSTTPAAGASGVATATAVSASFSEPIDPATLGASSFELRGPGNVLVATTLSYDAAASRATLSPSAALSAATLYTATVKGGANGVKDFAGNAIASDVVWSFTTGTPTGACAAPANAIVAENCLAGAPASEWDVSGAGDASIQGFATQISVNRGETVNFKVDTSAASYRFDIYRMGYYGGQGARKVATVLPSATLPQAQPSCLYETATGLLDCGNWGASGSWNVPANAVSGIYFAKLVRNDTGGASHVFFVVRDDASTSDLLFQTSDTTWQAYNEYGGNSLYVGAPAGRAYKVSYNRPFTTRAVAGGQDWVFNAEYPMVRWLESNGYDLSYTSGVDSDRYGSLLLNHKVFLSVGHDEYWSGAQRANVEAARNAGVNLAFFSGNEAFWKTRWEPSIDGSGAAHRTLVSYKETHANAKIDPDSAWTGTWRDPRFSPPADGGRPENALTGTIFLVNSGTTSIKVPQADGRMRLWRNTSVATLASGATATMPDGTLGYEWDTDADNGFRPPGLIRLSTTSLSGADVLLDYGSTYGSGTATHALTLYKHSSGALVFGAGTIQWAWGLDSSHDRGSNPADARMQQATVNLLADMRAQPATLQAGLVPAAASTDSTPPSSAITSPVAGAVLPVNTAVTISGTASDTGGGVVGGVEVSVDGGLTWRRANGRATWTYSWTPTAAGPVTIRSRAADDSANVQSPGAGTAITIGSDVTAPTITARTPASSATGVSRSTTVTATFSEAMTASTIDTTSFELRDASNALVPATVAYNSTNRRATLTPSSTLLYAQTYTATVKGGSTDPRVKDTAGNALAASSSWSFTTIPDITAPTVSSISPASGATGVAVTAAPYANFSEAMDVATINASTVELRGPGGTPVAATVTYTTSNRRATLRPTVSLARLTTYTMVVRGGGTDPRVKDLAGNALAVDRVWSFTTR
ncbi:Ig-like domain-containing protein [Rivibacter subsaxonicus]|uniref:Molybdenum-dependent oxidoreductase-like protein n=1 Tax=Rivibacter subsaxonicus TaxID=457575 RepID=A0A4Q7VVU5_9BURK|nr:Ig-like domain-containing protein [Rivibacter subsaxonicus]RZU00770.1 molybdenum-dependent oxidoreductase-like protein [Rivibacter subsaxonicus]